LALAGFTVCGESLESRGSGVESSVEPGGPKGPSPLPADFLASLDTDASDSAETTALQLLTETVMSTETTDPEPGDSSEWAECWVDEGDEPEPDPTPTPTPTPDKGFGEPAPEAASTIPTPPPHRHDRDRAQTIPKNHKRMVRVVFDNATSCCVYRFDDMQGSDQKQADAQWAEKALHSNRSAYLYWSGGDSYTVHVHSNYFYSLTSKPLPEIRAEVEKMKQPQQRVGRAWDGKGRDTSPVVPSTNGVVLSGKGLDENVAEILRAASIEGNTVVLNSGRLDRPSYLAVNEILTRLGGKWNRKAGGHVFPSDPRPALTEVLDAGKAPEKNPLAYFPTSAFVVDEMVMRAEIEPGMTVLEPSAGDGAIVYGVLEKTDGECQVTAIELDCGRAAQLPAGGLHHIIAGQDFLAWETTERFDRILMNPPFTSPSDPAAYVAHIVKAWGLLKPGGKLVAIIPAGILNRTDRATEPIRHLLARDRDALGAVRLLSEDAFKESGTGCRCELIWIEKDARWAEPEDRDNSATQQDARGTREVPDYPGTSEDFAAKLERFAATLEAAQVEQLHRDNLACQANLNNAKVHIHPGNRYTHVDVGSSAKYVVVNATGEIFGCKGARVIHRGHRFGTLDSINSWNWSGYRATPKAKEMA
jgi:hypothetical protein